MRRHPLRPVLGLLLAALLLPPLPAAGQIVAQGKETFTIRGKVVDRRTGTPLVGAWVGLEGEEWGTLSRSDGTFVLKGVPGGRRALTVEQLGYVTSTLPVFVEPREEAVELRIAPDPVLLEGIRIVTDRLERRARAVAVSTWRFDRAALVSTSYGNVLDFIQSRTPMDFVRCPTLYRGMNCAVVRGRLRSVQVMLDEMPLPGGLDFLALYAPWELNRVEVYAGGAHIRVYTNGFLERAARTRLLPVAFVF